MNCRQARIDLALCVGEDLPEAARRESLRQHVAQCPGCQAHYKRLRGALRVLESSDCDRTYDVNDSMWPQLAVRIRRLEETPVPASRFNGWLPFVAVTAACAMLVVVMDRQPTEPAPAIARDIFGVQHLFATPQVSEHTQDFLPVGRRRRWSTEPFAIEQNEPYRAERTALEQPSEPDRSTGENR